MGIKSLFLPITIFLMGYLIGKHSDSELHSLIEEMASKTLDARKQLTNLLLDIIDRIESISSDEVKANFEKATSIIKEKIDELSEEQ